MQFRNIQAIMGSSKMAICGLLISFGNSWKKITKRRKVKLLIG
jgi:hypothetical protein